MEEDDIKILRCYKCRQKSIVTEQLIHNTKVTCNNCGHNIRNKYYIPKVDKLSIEWKIGLTVYGILLIYIIWLIARPNPNSTIFSDKSDSLYLVDSSLSKNEYKDSSSNSTSSNTSSGIDKLEMQLNTELESFKKPFDNSQYNGSIDKIVGETILFYAWAELIKEGESSEIPSIKSKSKVLRVKVKKLQEKEFPIMRKKYAIIASKNFSLVNVDVYLNGNKNTIISYIGLAFADKRNIPIYHREVLETLVELRFKQERYNWINYGGQYSYYKIDSPNDGDIIVAPN